MTDYRVTMEDGTVLCHHGVKGQKWGIRRYQNEDGTLTKAGKKRYSSAIEKSQYKSTKSNNKIVREAEDYIMSTKAFKDAIKDIHNTDYYKFQNWVGKQMRDETEDFKQARESAAQRLREEYPDEYKNKSTEYIEKSDTYFYYSGTGTHGAIYREFASMYAKKQFPTGKNKEKNRAELSKKLLTDAIDEYSEKIDNAIDTMLNEVGVYKYNSLNSPGILPTVENALENLD